MRACPLCGFETPDEGEWLAHVLEHLREAGIDGGGGERRARRLFSLLVKEKMKEAVWELVRSARGGCLYLKSRRILRAMGAPRANMWQRVAREAVEEVCSELGLELEGERKKHGICIYTIR